MARHKNCVKNENPEGNNYLCSRIWSHPETSAARKQTSSCLAPTWYGLSSSGAPCGAPEGVGVVVIAVQVVDETVAKAAAWNNYLCCPGCFWIWSHPEPSAARKQTSSCSAPTWCGLSSSGAPWGAPEGVGVVVAVQVVAETVVKAAAWNNYLCCPVCSRIWSHPEPLAARKQTSSCLAPTWCRLSSSGAPWGAAGGVGVVVAVQVVVETVAKAAAWNNHLCCHVCSWIWSHPEPLAARKQTSSCLAPTWCELSSSGAPWGAAGRVVVVVAVQVVVETVVKAAACMVGESTATVRGRSFVSSMPAVCSWPRQWEDQASLSSAVNSIKKMESYYFSYFNILFILFSFKNSCYSLFLFLEIHVSSEHGMSPCNLRCCRNAVHGILNPRESNPQPVLTRVCADSPRPEWQFIFFLHSIIK